MKVLPSHTLVMFAALLVLVSIVSSPALAREKTDVIWLTNGDRFTGEIKQLEHGKLRLNTDSAGEIRIEWNDISRIDSDNVASPTSLSSQESVEGLLSVEYSRYVYDHPAVDLSARLSVFPSITQSGRTRAQLSSGLRWKVINDLFWDLSYYNTYDNDSPSGSESTSDYGIVTSIGYSF